MIWRVRGQQKGAEELSLVVSDVFIDWLRIQARDAVVRNLDAYRDTTLDTATLERWRDELARIEHDRADELAGELAEKRALPRDASVRDGILKEWVERALAADEHHRVLREIATAISLALEIGGTIHALGD